VIGNKIDGSVHAGFVDGTGVKHGTIISKETE
jgi:hypothetical protein